VAADANNGVASTDREEHEVRRLAHWCATHRRLVVVLWLVAVVGVVLAGRAAGTGYSDTFSLAGTESTAGAKLLQAAAPRAAGSANQIVLTTPTGTVTDAAIRTRVEAMLEQVARLPHVGAVGSPYAAGGQPQISRDGHTAFATVTFDQDADQLEGAQIRRVIEVAKSAASAELGVELGGDAISRTNGMDTGGLPLGMGAAGLVLLLVFGSLLAAAVPLITAGFALITGVAAIGLLSNVVSMPEFSSELALLVGLGVGVDYALFIVTRYRQALMRGLSSDEAIAVSLDTSGRAVVFAGVTVCIALLGMLALNVGVLGGMGVAASLVVAFTVLTAVTLLPALLSLFGKRLLTRRARRALAVGRLTTDDESPFWGRWARILRARPAALTAAAAVMLAIVAIPFLSLRVGATDAGLDPATSTTRKAYDQLADAFGPGSSGPLQLVADVSAPAQLAAFGDVVTAAGKTTGVASVTAPREVGGGVALAQVVPTGSPQDATTSALVDRLRDDVIPAHERDGLEVLVTGQTATVGDFADVIASKLPLFIGVVVSLSFLLLTAVFRSLLIPLMAAAMNLLSVAAAFGVVTAVFQWGWLSELVGVDRGGPIDPFLPVLVFAILFGLSMDYQVFLVSRIYEEWRRRGNTADAVAHGLAATGRTITAASAIMVLVFGAFVLGGEHIIKLFGVGLASAVLMDALIVRSVLIPGLMFLAGDANWWLPRRLERSLPHLNVEGTGSPAGDPRPRPHHHRPIEVTP
jgi:RND superfamily putative drug exporter